MPWRNDHAGALKNTRRDGLLIPVPVGELLAKGGLFEFADGGSRQSLEEDEGVRKLPFGEGFRQKSAEFFWRGLRAFFQNNCGHGTLLPLGVRDSHDRGLFDGWVTHQRVFYVHRTDPFATGFHKILGTIDNFDESFVIDGGDVAGLEPAVFGPSMSLVGGIVITGGHPRAANFKFAWGNAVAGSLDGPLFEAFRAHDPKLDEGTWPD